MMQGIDVRTGKHAAAVCAACFREGVIIETSGPNDEVVKVLAPLTICMDQFDAGIAIMESAFAEVFDNETLIAAE
jgi:diaminobutyrate-2-oxoglutarate transaminase